MAKKPGFMLYFEDYASLRETLSAAELVSVLDAMSRYSESGALPDEEAMSDAARICWRFVRPKLDRDARLYADKVEKRRNAANARWSNDAPAANACTCTGDVQKEQVQGFMPTQPNPAQPNSTVKGITRPRFIPPTLEEVRDYCESRGSPVDPQRFLDYYTVSGWKRGKTSIKDWRACVRTWERQNVHTTPQRKEADPYADFDLI